VNVVDRRNGFLRGINSEKKVAKALDQMKKRGIIAGFINLKDTTLDAQGMDFLIILRNNKMVPLQVKSSEKKARKHELITKKVFKSEKLKGVSMSVFVPGVGQVNVNLNQKIPVVAVLDQYRCYEVMQEISMAIKPMVNICV